MRTQAVEAFACVVVACAAASCGARPDEGAAAAQIRAGCYEITFGPPLHWRPASWSRVDTAGGARMRVELTQKPDSVSPVPHAFRVEPSRPPIELFVWRPTQDGIQLREWGVDTEFEFKLSGSSERLSGRGRSDGTIEGGAYHYALLAKKLPCEGFVPGFDPPRPARAGA